MRMVRRVIVCLLAFCVAGVLWAQQPKPSEGSVDSSVTVMGRDDSVIAVPAPGELEEEIVLPPLDTAQPDSPLVPPVSPPVADISLPPRGMVLMPAQPRLTLQ